MAKEYSNVHKQPRYWNVRYDEWNGFEGAHIVITQGDRELQIYLESLDLRFQEGHFDTDEIEELKEIAKEYKRAHNL